MEARAAKKRLVGARDINIMSERLFLSMVLRTCGIVVFSWYYHPRIRKPNQSA